MAACETCWTDASREAAMSGQHTADVYRRLLKERRDNPCATAPGDEAATTTEDQR